MTELDNGARVGLLVATAVCGAALYTFVENPIRTGKGLSVPWHFAVPAAVLVLVLGGLGYNAWSTQGWTWRYSPQILEMMDERTFREADRSNPLDGCFLGEHLHRGDIPSSCYEPAAGDTRPSVILVGDSTANHLTYGLQKALGRTRSSWSGHRLHALHSMRKPSSRRSARTIMPNSSTIC